MTSATPAVSSGPASSDLPTPRDAASVVLLRDGPCGLEVLLQRRHHDARVLGGMYVFPGGKLDAADLDNARQALQSGLHMPSLAMLNEPERDAVSAVALYVAALRELAEEACVRLSVADLQPVSRWITPRDSPVRTPRFDTRFFLALMPDSQTVVHDNHEAVDSLWLAPKVALQRHWAGELGLIPPQLMTLAQLARHTNAHSARAEVADRPAPCIEPEHVVDNGRRIMCYPGDPAHSVSVRALPGPTRLQWTGQRFEPLGGLEGWWTP